MRRHPQINTMKPPSQHLSTTGTRSVKQISLPEDLKNNEMEHASAYSTDSTLPPYSTTEVEIEEVMNSSPLLIRASLYKIPANKRVFNEVKLPIGLVVNPFNNSTFDTLMEQNANASERAKYGIWCSECNTYINKHTRIDEFIRTFQCNICTTTNTLADTEIIKEIKPSMIYDVQEHETKNRASEMVDEKYFASNKLKESNLCIMLENTSSNVLFDLVMNTLQSLDSEILNRKKIHRITLILFNESQEVITVNNRGKIALQKIIGTPFISTEYSMPVEKFLENISLIIEFLKNRERISRTVDTTNLLKLSIEISRLFLGSHNLMVCSQTSVIENEEHNNFIESYIFNNSTLHVIEFKKKLENPLSRFVVETNGSLTSVSDLNAMDVQDTFERLMTKEIFWGIRIDVKASNQLQKSRVYVNTQIKNAISIPVSSMDQLSCATISLSLAEKMGHQEKCYTQVIVSFYNSNFERKCLVLNIELTASENIEDIYDNVMFDALTNLFLRYITDDLTNLQTKSQNVQRMVIESLKTYKIVRNKGTPKTSLLIPCTMKCFIVLLNAYKKNSVFRSGEFYKLRKLVSKPCKNLVNTLYPRLVNFNDFAMSQDPEDPIQELEYLQLKYKTLNLTDIYLLDEDTEILIYIPSGVDDNLFDSIFENESDINTNTMEGILMGKLLEYLMKDGDKEVRIINALRGQNGLFDKEEEGEFLQKMYEDKIGGICDLSEFFEGSACWC